MTFQALKVSAQMSEWEKMKNYKEIVAPAVRHRGRSWLHIADESGEVRARSHRQGFVSEREKKKTCQISRGVG